METSENKLNNSYVKNLGYYVIKSAEYGGKIHFRCDKHKVVHSMDLSKKETKESICKNYNIN